MTDDVNVSGPPGGPAGPRQGRARLLAAAALGAALVLVGVGVGVLVARGGDSPGAADRGTGSPVVSAAPSTDSSGGTSGGKGGAGKGGGGKGGGLGPVVYVSPKGEGNRSGAGWDTAASLQELTGLLRRAGPGTQVWLRGDQGDYSTGKPISITAAGSQESPIVIKGVDAKGGAGATPMLVGSRSDPWTPTGEQGKEVFTLTRGSGHVHFENLDFRNQGNGCFRLGADLADVSISRVRAGNVRRFLENFAAGDETSATVTGLVVRDVQVRGYSRAFARIQYDSSGLLFEDVLGDSQGQDGDPFAQGVELGDTVHDAVFRRASMNGSVDTTNDYWNGDGFSAENKTHDITFEDSSAAGNTDAGFDIKSQSATLTRVTATDNKRNYRFWGGITVSGCTGADPRKRGGSGTQDQVHATMGAKVTMTGCTFTDSSPDTTVFDVDGTASLVVDGARVRHAAAGRLEAVVDTGSLRRDRVDVQVS